MERKWLVRWIYASAVAHLLAGVLLPMVSGSATPDWYHASVAQTFWGDAVPPAAREQQAWWLGLFGPTFQCLGVWMWGLAWFGDRRREPAAWLWMAAGLLLWGPQDMWISAQAGVWANVWIDVLTLAVLVPPLARLAWLDRRAPAMAGAA